MSWSFTPLLPASAQLLSGGAPPPSNAGYIKVWNGSTWEYKPMKVWNGSAWEIKPVKYYNGASWVITSGL